MLAILYCTSKMLGVLWGAIPISDYTKRFVESKKKLLIGALIHKPVHYAKYQYQKA